MKNLTFLSPLKIRNETQFSRFVEITKLFYSSDGGKNSYHIVKDDSPPEFKARVKRFMSEINPLSSVIDSPKTSLSEAFEFLIRECKTDYMCFIFDDVTPVIDHDFLTPCIRAMEENESLIQVCVGGTFISNHKTNTEYVSLNSENKILINGEMEARHCSFDDDSVWIVKNDIVKMSRIMYIMGFWNQVLRTSMCKRFVNIIREKYNPKDDSADLYFTFCFKNRKWQDCEGWSDGMEWLGDNEIGFLNFCPYIYPLDRLEKSIDDFKRDNCIPITEKNYIEKLGSK